MSSFDIDRVRKALQEMAQEEPAPRPKRVSKRREKISESKPSGKRHDNWLSDYDFAKKALETHGGSSMFAARAIFEGWSVGRWIHTQREKKKLGTLHPHYVDILERLPNWSWEAKRAPGYSGKWRNKYR